MRITSLVEMPSISVSQASSSVSTRYICSLWTWLTCIGYNFLGIPLINNALLADLYVQALAVKMNKGEVGKADNYRESRIPEDCKPWSHWIGSHA